jgi:hypothetical protein
MCGVLLKAVNRLIPMDSKVKQIVNILAIVLIVLWVVNVIFLEAAGARAVEHAPSYLGGRGRVDSSRAQGRESSGRAVATGVQLLSAPWLPGYRPPAPEAVQAVAGHTQELERSPGAGQRWRRPLSRSKPGLNRACRHVGGSSPWERATGHHEVDDEGIHPAIAVAGSGG